MLVGCPTTLSPHSEVQRIGWDHNMRLHAGGRAQPDPAADVVGVLVTPHAKGGLLVRSLALNTCPDLVASNAIRKQGEGAYY